jgi:Rap1a immunity proteins
MSFDGCGGYLLATAEQLIIAGWICERGDSTYRQYVAVARNYIHDHPEKWDQPPAFLVREALMGAFPCRSDTSKK